jgi:hypothetical protein
MWLDALFKFRLFFFSKCSLDYQTPKFLHFTSKLLLIRRQSQTIEAVDKNLKILWEFIPSINATAHPDVSPEDYFESFTKLEKSRLEDGIIQLK